MCRHRNRPHVAQHLDCPGSLLPHRTRSQTRWELGLLLALAACSQILDRSTGEAGTTRTRSPTPGRSNRCRGRKKERVKNVFGVSQGRNFSFSFFCFLKNTARVSHHPVNADKVFGFLGPDRKLHVAHRNSVITHPELVLVAVDEHLRQVVELWDQLLMDTTETHCLSSCFHQYFNNSLQNLQYFQLYLMLPGL